MTISKLSNSYDFATDSSEMLHGNNILTHNQFRLMQLRKNLLSGTTRKCFITLVDQTVVSATNFITSIIIGRACTKEEFGLYMLGFTIVVLGMDLQMSLIGTPFMIYSPRLKGNAKALYTGSTLIHQFALSALVIFCLAIAGVMLSLGKGPQGLTRVVWALFVAVTFIMLREYIRRVSFASMQMKTALVLDSFVAAIQIVGLLLLAYLGVLSASLVYWVIGAACGLVSLFWFKYMHKEISLRISQAIQDFRLNWSLGKWIFASGLLWTLSMSLYPWFIASFHGTASAGVWAACLGTIALGNPLLIGVQNFLGPRIAHSFAEGGLRALRRFAIKASIAFSALMAPLALILLVFGGSIMDRLYSAKYAGNSMVVSILAMNLLVSAGVFTFSRFLFVIGRADVDFKINFVPLFVLFTLGLWLVHSYGPLGAAIGLLLSNLVSSGIRGAFFIILSRSSSDREP